MEYLISGIASAWRSYSAQPKNEFGDYEIELYFGPQKNAKNPKICSTNLP